MLAQRAPGWVRNRFYTLRAVWRHATADLRRSFTAPVRLRTHRAISGMPGENAAKKDGHAVSDAAIQVA
ncbi:hypothetical protein [Xanthomonas phaseoli]|uniref:Uncharacterized protein n=1 Tax=Xanthomonas manihotis TaxID=43353 RepID=A0A8I1XHQ1_XANMN|nr:hypothetical protein [Xanthomonas phaseoli]RWU20099.1 hypothetical protein XANMN_04920 [Xanthomonas phaseoli pv. manihotis str. CIO151]KUF24967.1 hypothetical protein AO826_10105 [Xanthomonas phaseoli pv. manihotis]MBO9720855.1 hypothetical protein [Xanthomonas phaseoli pv. manihotis]MBO9755873.1 hypothetical protein [Xanthomonas phaseoli pv. manihotis]MBO9758253.1 hypothetical protein [Xanthomonas phaseoli pv. manihotis]